MPTTKMRLLANFIGKPPPTGLENHGSTLLDTVLPDSLFPTQRQAFKGAIERKDNWYQLIMRIMDLSPEVRNALIKTFLVEGNLLAWPVQEKMREKQKMKLT